MKLCRWTGVLLLCFTGAIQAAVVDEIRVVSATETAAQMLPPVQLFTIASAGTYTLRLTDAVKQGAPGDAFSALSVVIYRNAQLVKHLVLPSSLATTTASVTLAAGQYRAQVMGVTTGASLYVTSLSDAGATTVWSDAGGINAPPNSDFSTLQQTLALTTGASYTVTTADRSFPAALSSLSSVVTQGGNPPVCSRINIQGSTASCSFVASSAGNILTVLADMSGNAGMYSVKVVKDSDGTIAYAATLPLGDVLPPVSVNLPATDSYSLNSLDVGVPLPLSSFRLALVQGGEQLVSQTAPGSVPTFSAGSGAANLYVVATPSTGASGWYRIRINRGSNVVYALDQTVNDSADNGVEGYVFSVNLPAGAYSLQLRDFFFPQAFASLTANVTQGSVSKGSLATAGSLNFTVTVAGEVSIAILAKAAAGGGNALPTGLFGISVTGSGGATPVLEKTQGVGGSFNSSLVTVSAPTRYAVSATDFSAPQALDYLQVAVTRGAQQVGSIIGGGTFAFDATAGEYTVNYLTRAKSTAVYGTYGTTVLAAPAVTLSASPANVDSGGSATLTWTSTDAATCTASGNWSGAKDVSGTAAVGPLSASATYTLTCANAAGSTAASATVTVQAAPPAGNKKGGGAWSLCWLLGIAALGMLRRA